MAELRSYFKCYAPRFLAAAFVAAAVTVAAALAAKRFEPRSAVRLALAAVQAVSMGGLIVALVLRMRHLDELQRRIQFESLAIAFAVSGATVQGLGFFRNAGLPDFDWGNWGWPLMALVWGVAFLVVKKRYE